MARRSGGLTLNQLMTITTVPTPMLGDLLRRLPARFFDRASETFRPVAPAVLTALAHVVEDDGLDDELADAVELVAADPAPELEAWTSTPRGSRVPITSILKMTASRLAQLYAPAA
jgi:hypothetical protein